MSRAIMTVDYSFLARTAAYCAVRDGATLTDVAARMHRLAAAALDLRFRYASKEWRDAWLGLGAQADTLIDMAFLAVLGKVAL